MGSTEEMVAIVDRHNQVTGSATRRAMRAGRLIHRATFILVYNRRGELFLQKRTAGKDIYPDCYEIAAGGVVTAGETYESSAARELAEELGIAGVPLVTHFDFFYDDPANRVWGRVFSCAWDGPLVLQAAEVASGAFLPLTEIRRLARDLPFTPDSLYLLARLPL